MSSEDQIPEESLRDLVDDEHLASVLEESYQKSGSPKDDLAAARAWRKIESTLDHNAKNSFQKKMAPWMVAAILIVSLGVWRIEFSRPDNAGLKGVGEVPKIAELALLVDGEFVPARSYVRKSGEQLSLEVEAPTSGWVWILRSIKDSKDLVIINADGLDQNQAIHQIDLDESLVTQDSRFCAIQSESDNPKSLIAAAIKSWKFLQPVGCISITVE